MLSSVLGLEGAYRAGGGVVESGVTQLKTMFKGQDDLITR